MRSSSWVCLVLFVAACGKNPSEGITTIGGGSATGSTSSESGTDSSSSEAGSSSTGDVSETTRASSGVATESSESSSSSSEDVTTGESSSSSAEDTGPQANPGCADGQREGYLDLIAYPDIAACSGGWDVAGLITTLEPTCNRGSGDDAQNENGIGCTVADLCAEGWHVCVSAEEVGRKSPDGCIGATVNALGQRFYATRQSGSGQNNCGTGTNDFFGCGTVGGIMLGIGCTPLNRSSGNLCESLPNPWSCAGDIYGEANRVVKSGSGIGGALCCIDDE